MPKKAKPNGFLMFMLDYVEEQRKKGRNIPMTVAQTECDAPWKALEPEEKAEYNIRAKSHRTGPTDKFLSDGRSLAAMQAELVRKEDHEVKLNHDIQYLIAGLQCGSSLEEQTFCLIHVNTFCVTVNKEYVPAEIAIVEFNLLEGETSKLHEIIDPGEIPTGYMYEAKVESETNHLIPYPPYAPGDYRVKVAEPKPAHLVTSLLRSFLTARRDSNGRLPLLFALPKNVQAVTGALQKLSSLVYDTDSLDFRVAAADKLLFHLKNKCVALGPRPDELFHVLSAANEELERDSHCYTPGLGCIYHSEKGGCQDKYYSCSLSIARRVMFYVCDHCCVHINIDMIPGKHCPLRAATVSNTPFGGRSKRESGASSVASSSKAPSEYQGEGDDDEDDDDGFSVVSSRSRGGRGRGWGYQH